jgi:hypothetical protein
VPGGATIELAEKVPDDCDSTLTRGKYRFNTLVRHIEGAALSTSVSVTTVPPSGGGGAGEASAPM